MKTITSNIITEYEIKNSRFITFLFKITDGFDLDKILNQVKVDYPKATHYCYSYRTVTHQKSSDDGEPGGTAGIPMLNVLLKEDIVNVLAITVRYFGGIKLGAGGLVRAYTKSLTTALSSANYQELEEGYIVKLYFNYSMQKQVDYLLKNINIINKEFNDTVIYTIEISKNKIDLLSNLDYKIISINLIEII